MRFSEWLISRDHELAESLVGWAGEKISGFLHGVTTAAQTAAWAVSHPAQVPPAVAQKAQQTWNDLVKKYGIAETIIIMASLVIGVGIPVPGSIALFWVALVACKGFNAIYAHLHDKEEIHKAKIDPAMVKMEVERIKQELTQVANQEAKK